MQEPDSFSQRRVAGLELADPLLQASDFGLVLGYLCGTRFGQRGPFHGVSRHVTTFSRNQAPVEVTVEHRRLPPGQPVILDTPIGKPLSLLPIRLSVILVDELDNLHRRETRTDRHEPSLHWLPTN